MTISLHSYSIFLWSSFVFKTRLPSLITCFHLFADYFEMTWCKSKRCWFEIDVGSSVFLTADPNGLDEWVILKVICVSLFFLLFHYIVVGSLSLSWYFGVCCAGKWVWSTCFPTNVSFCCVYSVYFCKGDFWDYIGPCTVSLVITFSGKDSSLCS